VQYLSGATAIGPVVQGLRKPSLDLSRGATSAEIVHAAAIAALQCAP
jgi:phosphate acetyltransferase